MDTWQQITIIIYSLLSFLVFIKGLYQSTKKKNAYGKTASLFWLGIFVWGDAVIFGLFWFLSSLFSLLTNDWLLFLLVISVFWLVRSLGETIYWFNQQFSQINRNPPERLLGYKFFKNDSIWFGYQITWQCITIMSVITTLYLANLWLKGNPLIQ